MAFHFHKDRNLYFEHQRQNTLKYVLPFIEETFPLKDGMKVMEIGCGEGGNIKALTERNLQCVGVELSSNKAETAKNQLREEIKQGNVEIIGKNIYDVTSEDNLHGSFDLVMLKDVIEHIHDQPKLMAEMKKFLKPGGCIYFGFPPWQMPFGGHQQGIQSKILSKLPYYHILPKFLYRIILKIGGVPPKKIEGLMEIKDTRISIERFERIVRQTGYRISHKTHYLINPIYEYKFKLKPKKQYALIQALPYIRNYFTTCVYYLISTEKN